MSNNVLNIGTGEEISIRNLAKKSAKFQTLKEKLNSIQSYLMERQEE